MLTGEVWVITYWEDGNEPVVTVFNNKYAADRFYQYHDGRHSGGICADKCEIYDTFKLAWVDMPKNERGDYI